MKYFQPSLQVSDKIAIAAEPETETETATIKLFLTFCGNGEAISSKLWMAGRLFH